jgi:hypothetical protein
MFLFLLFSIILLLGGSGSSVLLRVLLRGKKFVPSPRSPLIAKKMQLSYIKSIFPVPTSLEMAAKRSLAREDSELQEKESSIILHTMLESQHQSRSSSKSSSKSPTSPPVTTALSQPASLQRQPTTNTADETTKHTAFLTTSAVIKMKEDPCKDSNAKLTPFELKSQGTEIGKGDKIRKYINPCKPPPFLHQEELQAPGLPSIPVPPPLEMPFLFDENPFDFADQDNDDHVLGDSGDRAGLEEAINVLNRMRLEESS